MTEFFINILEFILFRIRMRVFWRSTKMNIDRRRKRRKEMKRKKRMKAELMMRLVMVILKKMPRKELTLKTWKNLSALDLNRDKR